MCDFLLLWGLNTVTRNVREFLTPSAVDNGQHREWAPSLPGIFPSPKEMLIAVSAMDNGHHQS